MDYQKSGTYSEPGPVSHFFCHKCEATKATFREVFYKGYHAGGDEDRTSYVCPDCGSYLETEPVGV